MSAFDALRPAAMGIIYGVFGDEGTQHAVSGDVTRRAVITKDIEAVFADGPGGILSDTDVLYLLADDGPAVVGDRFTDAGGALWELTDRMPTVRDDQLKFEIKRVL